MEQRTSRNAILQKAKDLFTTKGFANTAVREICREAGVTAPVLYYHFGSKEGLFEAVVEENLNLDDFCDLLRDKVANCPDIWDKLHTFVHTYLTAFPVETLNPGLHLGSSTQLNPASLHQLGLGFEVTYQLVREILQAGVANGVFREVKVDTAAACLLGTVDSFVRSQVYLGLQYDLEQLINAIVDLFADGLRAD